MRQKVIGAAIGGTNANLSGQSLRATLSRILPPLYAFRVRSRIFRWYGQLQDIEQRISGQDNRQLLQELQELENRAEKVAVPLSYTNELYALRSNIALVRKKLTRPQTENLYATN